MSTPGSSSDVWRAIDARDAGRDLGAYLDRAAVALEDNRRASYEAIGVAPGMTVLDAGCGTGVATAELADLVGAAGRVHAFDFSEEMVAATRSRVEGRANVEVARGDITAIDLPEDAVDAARCERVVMHLEPLAARGAIAELVRVTRPGGRVAVLEPTHRQTIISGAEDAFARFADTIADPLAGFHARASLLLAGCVDVEVQVRPRVATTVAGMAAFAEPERIFSSAVMAGTLTQEGADDAMAEIARRDAEGTFLAVFVTYLTSGTVA